MTAPTNALERGTTPLVAPGDAFTARFELAAQSPGLECMMPPSAKIVVAVR